MNTAVSKYSTKGFSKNALNELEASFIEGEYMTQDEIIEKYFPSYNSFDSRYFAQKMVKSWLQVLKRRIWLGYTEWFGSVNEKGQFGIPRTKHQHYYILNRYRKNVIGNLTRATNLFNKGVEKHLIDQPYKDQLMLPYQALDPDEMEANGK